jgi:hypothetical protein
MSLETCEKLILKCGTGNGQIWCTACGKSLQACNSVLVIARITSGWNRKDCPFMVNLMARNSRLNTD